MYFTHPPRSIDGLSNGKEIQNIQAIFSLIQSYKQIGNKHKHWNGLGRRGERIEDGRRTDIEASIERADEIQSGRIDEGDVITAIDASPFDQSASDTFGFLVQLSARQRSVGRSFRSHQCE